MTYYTPHVLSIQTKAACPKIQHASARRPSLALVFVSLFRAGARKGATKTKLSIILKKDFNTT